MARYVELLSSKDKELLKKRDEEGLRPIVHILNDEFPLKERPRAEIWRCTTLPGVNIKDMVYHVPTAKVTRERPRTALTV